MQSTQASENSNPNATSAQETPTADTFNASMLNALKTVGASGDKEDDMIQQMVPHLMERDHDDAAAVPPSPSSQFNTGALKTLLVERLNGKSVGKTRIPSPQNVEL